MAKVGAQRAADLTGRSKSTVQRAMNNGKISYELDANGRRVVDVSELDRVFGLKSATSGGENTGSSTEAVEIEMKRAQDMLEMERLKMRVKFLEEQLDQANDQIEDLKTQRDKWEKQASQVLITSQYSQKQAEELREEIRVREQRAREKREQALRERMERMNAQNENDRYDEPMTGIAGVAGNVRGFINRFRES